MNTDAKPLMTITVLVNDSVFEVTVETTDDNGNPVTTTQWVSGESALRAALVDSAELGIRRSIR